MSALKAMRRLLARHLYGLRAIFLPDVCRVCGRHLLPSESCVCRQCLDGLPATLFETYRGNAVEERMAGRVRFRSAFSCFFFRQGETLRGLIHDFKYHSDRRIAREMGREMGRRALAAGFLNGYDCLIPVPLHPKRLKKRGYNQSQMLAQGISDVSGIPVVTDALLRTVYAGTQTTLASDQRFLNVKGDFSLGPGYEKVLGKAVLIVDDVFTTGATSEACAEPLLSLGGVSVGLATLAYAQR